MTQSIEIGFGALHVPTVPADDTQADRAPLSELDSENNTHVHGEFWIRVNGRCLPALGYFGPDDVCLGTWVEELTSIASELVASDPARYVFDEGEQGQPAYVFERVGDRVRVSLAISQTGDGAAFARWGEETCALGHMIDQIGEFLVALDAAVSSASPAGVGWVTSQRTDALTTGVLPSQKG
jgi:hypothetical protein